MALEYMDTSRTKKLTRSLFSERVINVWNDMPADAVDFTSLANFKKSITPVDITAHLKCFPQAFCIFVYLILSCVRV